MNTFRHRADKRPILMGIGLAGALFLTSACAYGDGEEIASPAPSATSSTPAAPLPDASPSSTEEPSANSLPTEDDPVSDGKGTYLQTTISPDDPAFSYDTAVVSVEEPPLYSEEDIQQAHRVAVEFAVDAIDSPMNGTAGDQASADIWWAENQARFDPAHQAEMYAAVLSPDPNQAVLYKGTHRTSYGLQYGPDKTHISSRTLKTTKIHGGDLNGRNAIAVSLEAQWSNAADVDGKRVDEYVVGQLRYTMVKDPSTGDFLITGSYATFSTNPVR